MQRLVNVDFKILVYGGVIAFQTLQVLVEQQQRRLRFTVRGSRFQKTQTDNCERL